MEKDWEYVTLSKRFEAAAERVDDPNLAKVYRSLAAHYRALDRWRQTIGHRYDSLEAPASADPEAPPSRRRE